jgi:hypothetical protein
MKEVVCVDIGRILFVGLQYFIQNIICARRYIIYEVRSFLGRTREKKLTHSIQQSSSSEADSCSATQDILSVIYNLESHCRVY